MMLVVLVVLRMVTLEKMLIVLYHNPVVRTYPLSYDDDDNDGDDDNDDDDGSYTLENN